MKRNILGVLKIILSLVGILTLAFVVTNFAYFKKNFEFWVGSELLHQAPDKDYQDGEPNRVIIKSLGIEAPLVYVEETDEKEFQKALQDGVVHYPNTAMPGQVGNSFFFGHSSDFMNAPGKYKTVFALLPRIESDAEILIADAEGRVYTYKVFEKLIVAPTQLEVLNQDKTQKILTLQTSYPVGTAINRYIVRAKLIETP